MPKIVISRPITISASPASHTVPLLNSQLPTASPVGANPLSGAASSINDISEYRIEGTHTLAGNVTVNPDSGAVERMQVVFKYRANLVTDSANGKAFSIFGFKFTDNQATKDANIECYFNGTTWEVTYIADFSEDGNIEEDDFAAESIPEAAFQDESIPERAFQDASVPPRALQPRSVTEDTIGEQAVGESELKDRSVSTVKIKLRNVTNDELYAMVTGTIKAGDVDHTPVDLQMNDEGAGAVLVAQGYNLMPRPKQIINEHSLDKDGNLLNLPGSIVTAHLGTYAVTPEKADTTMITDGPITVEIDITDGSRNEIMMGFKGYVSAVYATVKSAIVGNGTITATNDDDIAMTDGVITMSNADPVDQSYQVGPTDNNVFEAYDILKFIVAGSTGGKLRLSVIVVKLP